MKNRPIARCLTAARSIVVHALLTLQVLSERRRLVATALALTALAGATAAAGKDLTPADKGNGLSLSDERYLQTYERCWKEFKSQCGRNLLDSAWTDQAPVPDGRVKESTATMNRWLNPPEAPVEYAVDATEPYLVAPPAASGSCPASMAGEASSPTQMNAQGSGAAGCYQIMPETWAAYGNDDYASAADAPMSEQTAAMQRICAAQGNAAWDAADPC